MYNISAFLYEETGACERPGEACAEIEGILDGFGIRAPGLLGDLGSGTGLMSLWFAGRGWRVYGLELSAAMLAVAREKAAHCPDAVRERLHWQQGDISAFTLPPNRRLDAAICLSNTINHLVEREQVAGFVRSAFGALAGGGVLVLDSDTLATFQEFFDHEPTVVWDDGARRMIRACEFDPATGRARHTAVVQSYDATGVLESHEEVMFLQYHPEAELLRAFTAGGFAVEQVRRYNPSPALYRETGADCPPKFLWVLRKPGGALML